MRFSSIYDSVISLWGNEIDIADYIIGEVKTSPKPDGTTYNLQAKSSRNLSLKWNEVEKIIGSDNQYADLMVWTMYQVFHRTSENLFRQEKFKLYPKEVNKNLIEEQYYKNLQPDDWKKELAEYINDIA